MKMRTMITCITKKPLVILYLNLICDLICENINLFNVLIELDTKWSRKVSTSSFFHLIQLLISLSSSHDELSFSHLL